MVLSLGFVMIMGSFCHLFVHACERITFKGIGRHFSHLSREVFILYYNGIDECEIVDGTYISLSSLLCIPY